MRKYRRPFCRALMVPLSIMSSLTKTVHVTFFDLEDAFGSVPHPLIIHTLKRFNVPAEIQLYINTLYNNQLSRVFTDSFSTGGFPFKRGEFKVTQLVPSYF